MTTLTNSLTGQFTFGYDGLSRRTSLGRPNSVATTYNYDSLSRLLSVLHKAGTATLDGAAYAYDNAGNRTTKTNSLNNITEQYAYDPLYQLTQVNQGTTTTESYSYDSAGNRLSSLGTSTYSYNTSNELTATPAATFTYDNNGNTLSKTDSTGTRNYTWDFENRLTSVVLPGSGGTVTFKYDPFGRRIQKSSSNGTINYLYNGVNSLEEVDQTGNVLARYAQGSGVDEPLAELRSGSVGYYEQDGLGSVTSLSNTTASLANTYVYDAFGNTTASTGALVNSFQYTGRDYDPETGLHYYRARYYDSNVGRFISEDSARVEVDLSWYEYAGNNPTNYVDGSGFRKSRPPQLVPGTAEEYWAPFQGGFMEALRLLNSKPCQDYFVKACPGKDPVKTLQNSQYDFVSLSSGVGAQTNIPARDPGHVDVDINSNGAFIETKGNTATFAKTHVVNFGDLIDLRAIILLHELGHQLGIFPADSDDDALNWNHTLTIIKNCAPFAKEVKR
jgi:RHS repeat-associated protein